MLKSQVVMKREFEAMVRTKSFLIGTVLLPLLLIGIIAFQFLLFTRTGGGEYTLVIVDQSTDRVGAQTDRLLASGTSSFPGARPVAFKSEVVTPCAVPCIGERRFELVHLLGLFR